MYTLAHHTIHCEHWVILGSIHFGETEFKINLCYDTFPLFNLPVVRLFKISLIWFSLTALNPAPTTPLYYLV
jgi:hypothetical protein